MWDKKHWEEPIMSSISGAERYRITAQAIGLIELLGNQRPNSKQIRVVEQIVMKLRLSWEACENTGKLMQTLKQVPTQFI